MHVGAISRISRGHWTLIGGDGISWLLHHIVYNVMWSAMPNPHNTLGNSQITIIKDPWIMANEPECDESVLVPAVGTVRSKTDHAHERIELTELPDGIVHVKT